MGVLFEVDGRVGRVILQRPAVLNAIDEEMLAELTAAVGKVRALPDVRAVVLRGTGNAFCVGLDVALLQRAFIDLGYFRDVLRRFNDLLFQIESLDVPVVAAVNGLTRAGGFELVLACDMVVAAREARIGDVHTRFGVIPGGGGTQRMPRKIGDQRARELIYTSRWLSGAEAVDYGIALQAVPVAELDEVVNALTGQLTDKSRDCLGAVKSAIRAGAHLPLDAAVDVETEHFFRYLSESPDAREGFAAYVEGRKPVWA